MSAPINIEVTGKINNYDGYCVTVHSGAFGHVCINPRRKLCKCKPEYMVFYWDGKPNLSRLAFSPCKKHLADSVKQALKENDRLKSRTTQAR